MATDIPRADRYAELRALRKQGLTRRQAADRMGISDHYARNLINDPDGSKVAARKASYGGVCERCGGKTDGSNGRAKAPKLCAACYVIVNTPEHGTYSRYCAGCSCDACRAANRDNHRAMRQRSGPPPSHSASGYTNYGCRCEVCRTAWRQAEWLRYDVKKQQRVA